MAACEADVLLAHQAARAGRTAPRPREALPRRLQACMHELLTVNERYHEALHERDMLHGEVCMLREEVERLHVALAQSESRCEQQTQQLSKVMSNSETLREAHQLQEARTSSVEAQKGELQQLLDACMGQLSRQQQEIEALKHEVESNEAMRIEAFKAGFSDGLDQSQTEHASRLRQLRRASESQAENAFQQGRQQASVEQSAALLREQAHRQLLLQRAEEQRQQRTNLEGQLFRCVLGTGIGYAQARCNAFCLRPSSHTASFVAGSKWHDLRLSTSTSSMQLDCNPCAEPKVWWRVSYWLHALHMPKISTISKRWSERSVQWLVSMRH